MNWIDRAIAAFSPQRGLRRVQARAALKVFASYDGARGGRRGEGWNTSGTSANSEIGYVLGVLRNRSRDLVRNNPWANKALEELVANVVGDGIVCQTRMEDKKLAKRIDDLWDRFVEECDADGQLDFYGIQDLVERSRNETGEVLVRFRQRRPEDGFKVPLQLQVLEADLLDMAKTTRMPNGNLVIQGIEYDPIGRRVAYWLFPTHPGDVTAALGTVSLVSAPVPAAQVMHIYRKLRPGQGRGVPSFAPVIMKARDLDDLCDAFLMRKKVEACISAVRVNPEGVDAAPVGASKEILDGQVVEQMEPGLIFSAQPGEDIRFLDPSSTQGVPEYMVMELHAMAAGAGVPYQAMTGDQRQVSYSSWKAGRISFNRLCSSIQWKTMIPGFCRPVRRRFIDTISVLLEAATGQYGAEWSPPRWESVEPLKDAMADLTDVRSGLMTLPEAIRRRGYDPTRQLEVIAETNKALDDAGIVLDTDPRKVTRAGLTQADVSPGGAPHA